MKALGELNLLTVAEIATVMRVSKMTVYRLVHAGELPAVRVGRSFRVPEQSVHDYLLGEVKRVLDGNLTEVARWTGSMVPPWLDQLPNESATFPYRLCIGEGREEHIVLSPGPLASAVREALNRR